MASIDNNGYGSSHRMIPSNLEHIIIIEYLNKKLLTMNGHDQEHQSQPTHLHLAFQHTCEGEV